MTIHVLTEAGDFLVTEAGDDLVTEDSVPDGALLAVYPDPFGARSATAAAVGPDPFESGSQTMGDAGGCRG